jgi:hypothetical protein
MDVASEVLIDTTKTASLWMNPYDSLPPEEIKRFH